MIGFGKLPCPQCGVEDSVIQIDLGDLETCHCPECDNGFTISSIREIIGKWQQVIDFLNTAPARKGE